MSVIFGASFHDVVCLDIDDMPPYSLRTGEIERKAQKIGNRFDLGGCLIVLSGSHHKQDCLDWSSVNYHLIYDRLLHWQRVYWIIKTLADEGIVDKRLRYLQKSRGNFTVRMTKKIPGTFVPFPVGYIRCYHPRGRASNRIEGGIRKWLDAWKVGLNISKDMNIPLGEPLLASRSRSGPLGKA